MTRKETTRGITRVKGRTGTLSPSPPTRKTSVSTAAEPLSRGPGRGTLGQAGHGSRGPASGRTGCGARVLSPEAVHALADSALSRPERKAAVTVTRYVVPGVRPWMVVLLWPAGTSTRCREPPRRGPSCTW